MAQQFFEELSRCLRKEQIESRNREDRRLEVFLHGQPVLSVSPGNEVFLLPAGSKNPEANELYHRVATAADRVFEYVEAMENTLLLRARGLDNKFHLLADFGGAVLAGRERGTGRGYEFVTWIWDYSGTGDVAAYEGKTSLDESHGLVEWQADALATALLMPLPQIKRSFYRLRAGRSNEQLVAEMAQIFQVSKQAMRIRLETRNLI